MPIVLIGIFAALVLISFSWTGGRGDSILDNWAQANGYTLIAAERRYLRLGPFWFRCTKGQIVYFITVQRLDGPVRRGWARCGGVFLGLMSDAIKVIWEDGSED